MVRTTTAGGTVNEWAVGSGWSGRGSLQELVNELRRQADSKLDFVADARQLRVEVDGETDQLRLVPNPDAVQVRELLGVDGLPLRATAAQQLGERQTPQVPWRFLQGLHKRLPFTAANLLTDMLHNPQLDKDGEGPRRLVRCLDGSVRSFLSDRYRVIDNLDLAFAALGVARECGGEVLECSLSDTNMRIKFTSRQVWDVVNEARQGNKGGWYAGGLGNQDYLSRVSARSRQDLPGGPGTIHPVVTISNSETGHGGLGIRIGILRAVCFNLATVEDVVSRVHLGGRLDTGVLSPEAIEADNQALMLKARDSIKSAFDVDKFRLLAARCRNANEVPVTAPQTAVGNVVKVFGLPETAQDDLLRYFLCDANAGGQHLDPTAYGLSQAVARWSQDVADPDAAVTAENAAGAILLNPKEYALVGA